MIRATPLLLLVILSVVTRAATIDFRVTPGSLEAVWASTSAMDAAGHDPEDLTFSVDRYHGDRRTLLPFETATRRDFGMSGVFPLMFRGLEGGDLNRGSWHFGLAAQATERTQLHRTYQDEYSSTSKLPMKPSQDGGAPEVIQLEDATGFHQGAMNAGRQGKFPAWAVYEPPEPEYTQGDPPWGWGKGKDTESDPCFTPVPEPSSLGLALAGAVMAACAAKRRL
jgi:hypothetical protein